MKIEATAREISTLLQLAAVDAEARSLSPEVYQGRREAARAAVPRALLDRYQTLFAIGRWPVIAAIERGACSGCHVRLPTMVEQAARRSAAVHTCAHCHRMLYAPEVLPDGPGAPPPPEPIPARKPRGAAKRK